MSSFFLKVLFYGSVILGFFLLFFSLGWMAIFSAILILPMIILHFIAGIKALRHYPDANNWLLASCICFLLFFLLRPDFDDQSGYTGLSGMLYWIGLAKNQYTAHVGSYFVPAAILFVALVVIDLIMLFKKF